MLLHSVVGQVDESVVDVLQIDPVLRRRSSQVPLFEEEQVVILVKEDPDTDIKLSLVDQERPLDVLLYDEGVVFDLARSRV